jgi:hypothetical protein
MEISMTKYPRKTKSCRYPINLDLDYENVVDAIKEINEYLLKVPEEYRSTCKFLSEDSYYESKNWYITWDVPETDEKYELRTKELAKTERMRIKNSKAKRDADELAIYEKVKAKLEGNKP